MSTNMNRLYDFCATDSSFANGRATKQIDSGMPASTMSIPCDGCSNANICAISGLECKAFKQWSHTGKYNNKNIAKSFQAI